MFDDKKDQDSNEPKVIKEIEERDPEGKVQVDDIIESIRNLFVENAKEKDNTINKQDPKENLESKGLQEKNTQKTQESVQQKQSGNIPELSKRQDLEMSDQKNKKDDNSLTNSTEEDQQKEAVKQDELFQKQREREIKEQEEELRIIKEQEDIEKKRKIQESLEKDDTAANPTNLPDKEKDLTQQGRTS